ncbi:MAG TPA: VOC family protein [Pseudonocardia sp.]|uniref:VOC family protein n=1 Tax=Pseudonocardia sp. TaxID=60912 RepID=UPI002BF5E1DE|nr:VOC family protein [Pseudonocardia sp.]HTF50912.1 VOC family protein [Pseudonocardia sp.]
MSVTLSAVTVDCADAAALAQFWAGLLDRGVDEGASKEFAAIGIDGGSGTGPGWTFVRVPEAKGPKNRVHFDFAVGDLTAEVERIVGLGARPLAQREEDGVRWTTLADPEGNEFCVIANP